LTEGPVVLLKLLDLKPYRHSESCGDLAVLGGSILVLAGAEDSARAGLVRMIAGQEKRWSGIIRVGRRMVEADSRQARKYVGYVRKPFVSPPDVTPRAHLMLTAAGYGLGRKEAEGAVEELIRWCSLASVAGRPLDTVTEDQRYATGFAAALLHGPQLMVVEGPVPESISSRLDDISDSGRAVVLAVPGIEHIPPGTDRIALCSDRGIAHVVRQSDLADACRKSAEIRVSFYPSLDRRIIEGLPGARGLVAIEGGYRFRHTNTASAVSNLANMARANARSLVGLEIRPPSIRTLVEHFSEEDEPGEAQLLCLDDRET
jgi:ABC-type multidrug transport system ATPase subunit